jgi:predicted Zn-ribbon and HTH transcriptional regulator
MRGTEEVPIWESPYPLVYAQKVAETWKNRRTLRHATEELDRIEVQFRFSFYHDFDIDEDDLNELETTRKRYGWEILADGSCHMCGEEFESDKLFCCERCEKACCMRRLMKNSSNGIASGVLGPKIADGLPAT